MDLLYLILKQKETPPLAKAKGGAEKKLKAYFLFLPPFFFFGIVCDFFRNQFSLITDLCEVRWLIHRILPFDAMRAERASGFSLVGKFPLNKIIALKFAFFVETVEKYVEVVLKTSPSVLLSLSNPLPARMFSERLLPLCGFLMWELF